MVALLEVLIGSNVKENLVVMVDNQSKLREISRWVGEGGRTFLALSANPDILRMVIGRLCSVHEDLCQVKSHRGEPLNELVDNLADLGRTIDPEYDLWTARSDRMVFSWIDGQKTCLSARTSVNMEPRSEERGATGSWTIKIRSTIAARSVQLVVRVLVPRSHGKIENDSTLGTTHGYVDERLPFPRGRATSFHGYVDERLPFPWQSGNKE
jgi:hypothetical protein